MNTAWPLENINDLHGNYILTWHFITMLSYCYYGNIYEWPINQNAWAVWLLLNPNISHPQLGLVPIIIFFFFKRGRTHTGFIQDLHCVGNLAQRSAAQILSRYLYAFCVPQTVRICINFGAHAQFFKYDTRRSNLSFG